MSNLDDLRKRGLIEKVEPDQATATGWPEDAGWHLEAATKIAELDPSGGLRPGIRRSQEIRSSCPPHDGTQSPQPPGIPPGRRQYAESIATQVDEPAQNRFDRLRRNRHLTEYGSRTFGKAEIAEVIDMATAIRAACASLV